MSGFTGIDIGVAVLVLISAILATARGFTREILSLATWAGSAAIAAYVYFKMPWLLKEQFPDELWRVGVTVVGSFLVALIVLHLLTMWIGDMVVDSRIGPLDRTLGFIFGAARGVLICIVAAWFANFLLGPEDKYPDWLKGSKSFPPLMSAADFIVDHLPPDVESQITQLLQKRNSGDTDTGDTTTDASSSAEPDTNASSSAPAA
jgi:membrane protein required for colicin V production